MPVLWAGAGFAGGIAFWHGVGFWALVSTAVLGDKKDQGRAIKPPLSRRATMETASVTRPAKPGCISLVIHRSRGETVGAPCAAATFHHVDAGLGIKKDKVLSPAWSSALR
jgi:hypothetical protein